MCSKKAKRIRSINWEEKEKLLLIEAVKENIKIVECKRKCTAANRDKLDAWKSIQRKLKIQGYSRDTTKIKQEWQRLKVQAKKSIAAYKKAINQTGGGPRPDKPPETDWVIKDLIPYEFEEDVKPFDCDETNNDIIIDEPQITINNPRDDKTNENIDKPACLTHLTSTVRMTIENIPIVIADQNDPIIGNKKPGKASKNENLTEYEKKLYELNKLRIEQTMRNADEMHTLKMENEREYHKKRMDLLLKTNDCKNY